MGVISDALERRTVDFVERGDKDITIICTDGYQITLGVDKDGDIQLVGTGIRLTLEGLSLTGEQKGWI